MFSGFMLNAWEAGSMVAVVAGVVGFFIVLRGSAFVAHALPNGAFAGAAGASLIGVNALVGLGSFSVLGALLIAALGRRARHDIATALTIVMMLGLGALFLSMTTEYGPQISALLFGEVLGVSTERAAPDRPHRPGLHRSGLLVLYRPLMYSSVMPDVAAGNGVSAAKTEVAFLIVVALTTSMAVPVVGSLLIFSLLISPPAAARSFTNQPGKAMALVGDRPRHGLGCHCHFLRIQSPHRLLHRLDRGGRLRRGPHLDGRAGTPVTERVARLGPGGVRALRTGGQPDLSG